MRELRETLDQKTKNKLNVLEKGETRRERIWKECVHDAKMIMATRQELRWEIVRLAEKCCVVELGGKPYDGRYTLRNFAKEIGLAWATFYQWYRIKTRIYDNLPVKQKDQVSFAELRFVEKEMATTGVHSPQKYSKQSVSQAFKKIKAKSESTLKMEKYLTHLKSIHYNVTNELKIKDCDSEVLGEVCHLARGIVNALNKYDRK